MKNLKEICLLFLYVFVFFISHAIESNAIIGGFSEREREQTYKYEIKNKKEVYSCEVEGLLGWGNATSIIANSLFLPVICKAVKSYGKTAAVGIGASIVALSFIDMPIDMKIELSNPWCLIPVGILTSSCITCGIVPPTNTAIKITCAASIATAAADFVTTIALSESAKNNVQVCGQDWNVWGSNAKKADKKEYYPSKGRLPGSYSLMVKECFEDPNPNNCPCSDGSTGDICTSDKNIYYLQYQKQNRKWEINNRIYREYRYSGYEVESDKCKDSRIQRKSYDIKGDAQLYYMRGTEPGEFACHRFKDKDEYKCCTEEMKKLCLISYIDGTNKDPKSKFAIHDEVATIIRETEFDRVTNSLYMKVGHMNTEVAFKVYKGNEPNKLCARSYSLCPYNLNVGGGTEISQYDSVSWDSESEKAKGECIKSDGSSYSCRNKVQNFCQLNRHCTYLPTFKSKNNEVDYNHYIDKSCINFIGSSQNTWLFKEFIKNNNTDQYNSTNVIYRYDMKSNPVDSPVYTSSIVECLNETFKNMALNTAGHTKCIDGSFGEDDECQNNSYKYKIGTDLAAYGFESPISILLNSLKSVINIVFLLYIVIKGFDILSGNQDILSNKKAAISEIIKITAFLLFSTTDYWYKQLADFTFSFSNSMIEIANIYVVPTDIYGFTDGAKEGTEKVTKEELIKYDGCYFGKFVVDQLNAKDKQIYDKSSEAFDSLIDNNYSYYPSHRKYISIFDSIDCKLRQYLRLGSDLTFLNLIIIAFSSLISGFGIIIFASSLIIFFFGILFAIKAAFIFMMASAAMSIMILISPFIIMGVLFKATSGWYKSWLKNLISYALQPMILVLYVNFAFIILDKYGMGSATYKGEAPFKTLNCNPICEKQDKSTDDKSIEEIYKDRSDPDTKKMKCEDKGIGSQFQYIYKDPMSDSVMCIINNYNDGISDSIFASILSLFKLGPEVIAFFKNDGNIYFMRFAILFFFLEAFLGMVPEMAASLTGGTKLPSFDVSGSVSMVKKVASGMNALSNVPKSIASKIGDKIQKSGDKSKKGSTPSDKSLKIKQKDNSKHLNIKQADNKKKLNIKQKKDQ